MRQSFYDEYYEIEDRHWWFVGRREIFLRVLETHLGTRQDLEILDIGCGTGTMVGHLSAFGRARGVDANHTAVEMARRRGAEVSHVPPGPLPFPDASVDLATALDVIEHVEDDHAALAEMHRLLRPGGTLLVAVPAFNFLWGPQDEISHHKRRYVASELHARLRGAGFAIRRLTYFNSVLFPAIAAIRVLRPYKPGAAHLRSDFDMTNPRSRANRVLSRVFASEAPLVARHDLPFGVSLLALCEKST
jgi:SAM-dependent methyltransferase